MHQKKQYKVVLYMRPTCPYCLKVFQAIDKLGKEIEMKDISNDESRKLELIESGGKQQVPCIFIDEQPMYESDDIIHWLYEYADSY